MTFFPIDNVIHNVMKPTGTITSIRVVGWVDGPSRQLPCVYIPSRVLSRHTTALHNQASLIYIAVQSNLNNRQEEYCSSQDPD